MNISVIIPIFNESDVIKELCEKLILAFSKFKLEYEIIFVDDGSTDNTKEIINDFQKENKFIHLIEFINNFGQEQAIYAGFKQAKGNFIVTMDGDLQIDPEDIFILLDNFDENTDIVCGCRNNRDVDPFYRKICSKLFNKMMNYLLKTKLNDFGSNFRIYKKEVVNKLLECKESFLYTSVITSWLGYNVKEVFIKVNPRKNGNSKYNVFSLLKIFLYLFIRYSTNVFQIFIILNSILFLLFFSLLTYKYYLGYISGELLTILLLILSMLFMLFLNLFFIGEYLIRIYSDVQFNPQYIIRKTYGFNNKKELVNDK